MAIAFIPVRDQAKVITGNRDSGINKGRVLKRLSTGKKVSEPRDNVQDYNTIRGMKDQLTVYNDAIKQVSLGTSLFEVALSTYQLLNEYYTQLASQAAEAKSFYNGNDNTDTTMQKYYLNSINATIKSIDNLIKTKFNGTPIASHGTDTNIEVKVPSDYGEIKVTVNKLDDLTGINGDGIFDTWNDNNKKLADQLGATAADTNTLKTQAEDRAKKALNNYQLLLSGVTSLANIEKLAQVQKTNATAAISALEDIDVQEEMMDLIQAQILEELSTEALIKIKESSKYIINLIRA